MSSIGANVPTNYVSEKTLDDAMRMAIEAVMAHGHLISPTKGPAKEVAGFLIEISEPRSRISRTETRGKPFSCLGELCWYLAGSNEAAFITYYIPRYQESVEGSEVFGGYGPRLVDWRGVKQLESVTTLLRAKPDSRRAVVQLFDALDLAGEHVDVPCTCTLQFLARGGCLSLIASMRSNDVFLGLPHDVYAFTMLQELIARDLGLEIGTYTHFVGSFHLYEKDFDAAQQFLEEGWQADSSMPAMPTGSPWPAVDKFLAVEASIRQGDQLAPDWATAFDPYWADLVRLLLVHRAAKALDSSEIESLITQMTTETYGPFIRRKLDRALRARES